MKLRRIIRDAFIMVSFCGTFYVSTFMWGKVDEKPPSNTNFSSARVDADEFNDSKRWELAAEKFKRMTELDPYNGYAWYCLGTSYNNVRYESQYQIRLENESESPSEQKIGRLKAVISKHDRLALEAHETARQFLRYRSKSLFQLSVIYADISEFETSLACIREFVDNGHWTFNGLDAVSQLGFGGPSMVGQDKVANSRSRLHAFAEFWELVDQEDRQTRNYHSRKRSRSKFKKSL